MKAVVDRRRSNFPRRFLARAGRAALLLAVLAGSPARAATVYTWTATTSGNWSGANWSSFAPSTDGMALVSFGDGTATFTSTIDNGWWADPVNPGPVYGFTFGSSSTTSTSNMGVVTVALGTGVSGLSIGAGGVTNYYSNGGGGSAQAVLNASSITLAADQTWNTVNSNSFISTNASFKGSGVLTKDGAGTLLLSGGSGSAWTGSFVFKAGKLQIQGSGSGSTGTIGQLGTNAMTWYQGTTMQVNMGSTATTYAFATPISFNGSSTGSYTLMAYTSGNYAGNVVDLQGPLSGTLGAAGTSGLVLTATGVTKQTTFRLSGNNSSLTSPVALGNGVGPFAVKDGNLVVANANALGSGNSLGVALGYGASAAPGFNAGLYAENGMTVAANVYSGDASDYSTHGPLTLDNYVGTWGTGTATFTGNITLAHASSNTNSRASNLHLTATPGAKAVFSGLIADDGGTYYGAVLADGGGLAELARAAGNTYAGGTTVSGGTDLVVSNTSGSATGTGSVYVGASAQSGVTGTARTAATGDPATVNGYYVTGINTTGLRVGQTVTSASAGVSGVIQAINPNGLTGTIQISVLPTAAGTFSDFAFGSLAGTVGGGGIIKPGTGNSIQVAGGSLVYPGVKDGATATTLKLDGGSTGAALLTMSSGAAFTFNLGAPGTSDQIDFLNWAAGDLTLNNNTVYLSLGTGAAAGTYTLFQFYSDAGTTLANSGITSGLALDSASLGGFDGSLSYNGTSISLTLTAAPEPSDLALLLAAAALLALFGGRSLRRPAAAR